MFDRAHAPLRQAEKAMRAGNYVEAEGILNSFVAQKGQGRKVCSQIGKAHRLQETVRSKLHPHAPATVQEDAGPVEPPRYEKVPKAPSPVAQDSYVAPEPKSSAAQSSSYASSSLPAPVSPVRSSSGRSTPRPRTPVRVAPTVVQAPPVIIQQQVPVQSRSNVVVPVMAGASAGVLAGTLASRINRPRPMGLLNPINDPFFADPFLAGPRLGAGLNDPFMHTVGVQSDGFGDVQIERVDAFGDTDVIRQDAFGDREEIRQDAFGDREEIIQNSFGQTEVIRQDVFGDTSVQFNDGFGGGFNNFDTFGGGSNSFDNNFGF